MSGNAVFEKVYGIIESEKILALKTQAEHIGKALNEDHSIDIAVLGEFKVGKSSFINSFIGKDVLPTGVIPVTSVITRIGKGDREEALVRYFSGNMESVKIEDIDLFVNESENPDNVKQVEYVDIKLPQSDFFNGLHIVDTPGLGSFWKHNTETTRQWFGRVGVAIVAISAERPLSEDEISLIKEIEEETPEVVILLTKTDLFNHDEIEKIESFIRSSLKSELKREFRIFRYSLRKNTSEFKQTIIRSLIEPLNSEFDRKRDAILNHKTNSLRKHCIAYLDIARISSLHSDGERAELKKVIFDRKINQNFVAREMALVLSDELNGIREKVMNILISEEGKIIDRLTDKFSKDYKKWNGNLYKRTRTFEDWMKRELSSELIRIADAHKKEFEDIVKDAAEHFGFFTTSFRNSLKEKIEKVLQIEMPVEEPDIHFEGLKNPDIRVSWTFESHIDLLWFLFPMPVFGRMFGRFFKKQIPREVEINIYRLTSGINALISKAVRDIKEQSQKYISGELETIENILIKTTSKTEYYESLIEELRD